MKRIPLLVLLLAACSDSKPAAAPKRDKPHVYAVNYPLSYFARRIGGARVDVRFPAPSDIDPVFWKPDRDAVALFQGADVILLNGATYAKWIAYTSLPATRCVDTSASFRDRFIETEHTTHTHGPAGKHDHGGIAFTTWLDVRQAIAQARAIRDALDSSAGYADLERDLLDLDKRFRASAPKVPVVASHPVYQYWARAYGVKLRAVQWEPDAEPDAAGWAALRRILAGHPAHWMIWEGEPLPATKRKLEELGLESVVLDPCANVPESGDFLSVMRANADNLEGAFGR